MEQVAREFEERARRADSLAVIDDKGEHSARDVVAAGTSLAAVLRDAGLSHPTVLVQADNSWRTVVAALGIGRLGGLIALMSGHATPDEFAAACEDIKPDAILGDAKTRAAWKAETVMPGRESIQALDDWQVVVGTQELPRERWRPGVVIGMTSGSTGRAKGVVQSESALRYASQCSIEANNLEPGDVIAGVVPLSSTAAFCFGLYLPLLLGSPVVYWHKWDPVATVKRMAERDARWTMCVPTMVLQLAAAAEDDPGVLDCVKSMTIGGGPMDRDALHRAEKTLGTKILRVFGMSECLGHTTPRRDDEIDIRLGRDGRPFEGTEVRAVDASGEPLPVGATGHAQVRGPSLFVGYARDGRVHPPDLTADGFFATGDLVRCNEDGTISIMGREKDVIIRGGRNIDITEVEVAISGHPRVRMACVVPVPDELLGERVAVLVIPTQGHLELADITAYLDERGLAKTKWPEYVFEVAEIPQTRVGKASRRDATAFARELLAGSTQ